MNFSRVFRRVGAPGAIAGWWMMCCAAFVCAPSASAIDQAEILRLLSNDDPKSARQAAEAIQKATFKVDEELVAVVEGVKSALSSTRDSAAEAALRLALGKLAATRSSLDDAEWGFESMSVTHSDKTPREVFEAHARALEMVPGAAKELMIGNLDVALNFPDAEPKERQRLKEFVTLTAEAMQTRELADFLDALLSGEDDLFVKIEAPLEARLLACYRRVKVEPQIKADAVVQWLDKHPGGPPEVEIAALETISLVGTTKAGAAAKLAERLLAKADNAVIIGRRLKAGYVDRALLPQVLEALERHVATSTEKTAEVKEVLAELKKLVP